LNNDRLSLNAAVPLELAGQRFDAIAAQVFADYSRSRLKAWIEAGALTVDGAPRRPRDLLLGGEKLALETALEAESRALPQAIALNILFEDRHVLVVNKPPGLIVHPGAGVADGTLENALLHHAEAQVKLPRAGIIHRLDKDTSGALVVAKSLKAHAALVAELAAREMHRQYEAVVHGAIISGATVDAPLGRHPSDRLRQAVVENGREAVTHYRVIERFRAHTHLRCQLETGRTHQIRVHLAYIRHAIIGDPLYGGALKLPKGASSELIEALRGFRRQALHAERLEFTHPVSGKPIAVDAPRPADFSALLDVLKRETEAHVAANR
jgi:23S rRNA pseudouridine1911/1915/1917 synthase